MTFPIETQQAFDTASERERQLKHYRDQLKMLENDILLDPCLTIDDKAALVPGDQLSNVNYILSTLKCDMDDYADRVEIGGATT